MTGDGENQPVESAVTLSDLASELDDAPETEEEAELEVEGDESEVDADDDAGEEDEAEADDEDDQEEPTVVLKHDGKEVTLKQSEVVALAQQGFDYSKKTMAVAEERKAVDAARTEAETHRKQHELAANEAVQRLTAYTRIIEASIGDEPDVSLAAQDAGLYLARKAQHDGNKDKLREAYAEIQQIQDDQARQRQAKIDREAAATEAALKDTLPGWNNDMLRDLAGYAKDLGLTPETAELAMLTPGFWQLIDKAKKYDAVVAKRAEIKPKATLPKVQKPSGANHPNRAQVRGKEAEAAYRANPSISTLSNLID